MSSNTESTNPNLNSRLTSEGCSVLLDINDGDRLVFARLSASASVSLNLSVFSCLINELSRFDALDALQEVENWE